MTTAAPVRTRPMTVNEYASLGEDPPLRWAELQEGNLVMAPTPTFRHMRASARLFQRFVDQLPSDAEAVYEINVDLQLGPPDGPGTVRTPDIVVITASEAARAERHGDMLRASGVVLAVEIVSPGSNRTDRIIKRREYADAGIPHYWIVELDPHPSLTACNLVDGSYQDHGPRVGAVTIDRPFPVRLDVDALC